MAIVEQETRAPKERLAEPDPVFLRAAEIVRERWGQGFQTERPMNSRCAAEALEEVVGFDFSYQDRLEESLGIGSLVCWNDAPERTKEEVAEAFKRAAWGL